MSHSKRNTSLAFFTSHERSLLRSTWGSQSQRLNRDSFIQFGSCMLCLMPCHDPVVCPGGPMAGAPAANGSAAGTSGNVQQPSESRKRKRDTGGDDKEQCHLFCRECIMSNLLAQRKELKRLERLSDAEKAEALEMDARADEEARSRAVEDFERVQQGFEPMSRDGDRLTAKYSLVNISKEAPPAEPKRITDGRRDAKGSSPDRAKSGGEHFELDEERLLNIAREERKKARQALSDEKAANSKSSLPSFWVPSLTPSGQKVSIANGLSGKKMQPVCPGSTSSTSHPLSLKTLVPVNFSEESDERGGDTNANAYGGEGLAGGASTTKTKLCPACSRQLTNASHATLAKPCGHVVCGSCVSRFIIGDDGDVISGSECWEQKELRCFVCNETLTERKRAKAGDDKEDSKGKDREKVKPGLIEICSEGTGFASGGKNVVKAEGTAFQC